MSRSQDPINIVSRIRGYQNRRDRKDDNPSQRDSRTSHHSATFIASVFCCCQGERLEPVLTRSCPVLFEGVASRGPRPKLCERRKIIVRSLFSQMPRR